MCASTSLVVLSVPMRGGRCYIICSECQAVVFGDLTDLLGGELGGVCDDPERYAALEQFQRDLFHGVVFAVFHCNF